MKAICPNKNYYLENGGSPGRICFVVYKLGNLTLIPNKQEPARISQRSVRHHNRARQSCLLIMFQYQPISLQYSQLSVEQPITFRLSVVKMIFWFHFHKLQYAHYRLSIVSIIAM